MKYPESIYLANVTRVIDGDTFVADVDLGFKTWIRNVTFRLYGVDTPEVRGKRKTKLGLEAKEYVKDMIQGKTFLIKSYGRGKYRWLADIMLPGERPLSLHLISIGYGEEMKK